ncbi:MAG: beta-hydroxyacyl-ACP dehydratase [Pirellulaceae bacterium]
MRWFWIDRFIEFERGKRAAAVKGLALGEEQIDRYMPGFPLMPHSLIVEGFAQTGGIIVSEYHHFQRQVVLAKVAKAVFHDLMLPGDLITYRVKVESLQTDGAVVTGQAHIGERLQAEVELFFAALGPEFSRGELFEPFDFLTMMRLLRLYEVGRQEDGSPLDVPEHMLAAERSVMGPFETPRP